MSFSDELKELRIRNQIGVWFTVEHVKNVTENPEASNLSNYCVDNSGSSNKNNKILQRRRNENGQYEYSFL